MNIALWVVQAVLALAFIAAGSMKVFAYEKYKAMSEKNGPMDLKRGLVTFIGLSELAGAIGVCFSNGSQRCSVAQPHGRSRTCDRPGACLSTTCAATNRLLFPLGYSCSPCL
jgi:hypothetical protein